MPTSNHAQGIRRTLTERGIATSAELQQELRVSQPTVSRALSQMVGEVLTLGAGPTRRYALPREVPRVGRSVGVFSISPEGAPAREGDLLALAGDRSYFEPAEGQGQMFSSLPWFALDQRPEGYLGRALARAYEGEGFPPRLADWNDSQVLYALVTFGGSARGDLIFGDPMLLEAQRPSRATEVEADSRSEMYPQLAAAATAGNPPGSSAGGEQPKFEAIRVDGNARTPVIVKFSPPTDSAAGARWRDILVLEDLANAVLNERGIASSASQVIESQGRAFLEVARFDRVGVQGRRRVFSLGTIDDQFIGKRQSWGVSAASLQQQRRLSRDDMRRVAFIEAFGILIENSDMHFGNLSFYAKGLLDPRLEVAPVYDMSPMRFAPNQEGVAATPEVREAVAAGHLLDVWRDAREAAIDYWRRASALDLAPEMRAAALARSEGLARQA